MDASIIFEHLIKAFTDAESSEIAIRVKPHGSEAFSMHLRFDSERRSPRIPIKKKRKKG